MENFYDKKKAVVNCVNLCSKQRGCSADNRASRTLPNTGCIWLPITSQTDPVRRLLTSKAHSFLLKINRGVVPFGHQVTDYFWTRTLLLAIPLLYLWELLMIMVLVHVNSLKSENNAFPPDERLQICLLIPFRGLLLLIALPQQEL